MNTATPLPFSDVLPPEVMADMQAIVDKLTEGKPVDPEVAARIRAEADKIREDIYKRHGLLDIGVPAIREFRDR